MTFRLMGRPSQLHNYSVYVLSLLAFDSCRRDLARGIRALSMQEAFRLGFVMMMRIVRL